MDKKEFGNITKKGNYVAWTNETEPETTAIAYMIEDGFFDTAINCIRDGDMGEKDADGVYSRHWASDAVWMDDNPRLATEEEIKLYKRKTRKHNGRCIFVNEKSVIVPKGYPNAQKYISAEFIYSFVLTVFSDISIAKKRIEMAMAGLDVMQRYCTTDEDWPDCINECVNNNKSNEKNYER